MNINILIALRRPFVFTFTITVEGECGWHFRKRFFRLSFSLHRSLRRGPLHTYTKPGVEEALLAWGSNWLSEVWFPALPDSLKMHELSSFFLQQRARQVLRLGQSDEHTHARTHVHSKSQSPWKFHSGAGTVRKEFFKDFSKKKENPKNRKERNLQEIF